MMEFFHRSLLLTVLVCMVTCLPQAPANCLLDVPGKDLNGIAKVDTPEVNVEVPGVKDVPGTENLDMIPKVDATEVKTELPGIKDLPSKENLNGIPKVDIPKVNVEVPGIKDVPSKENLNGIPKVDTSEVNVEVPGIKDIPGKENLNEVPKVDATEVKRELPRLKDVPGKENLKGIAKVDATGVKELPGIKVPVKETPKVDTKEVKRKLPGLKGILKTLGIGTSSLTKADSKLQGLVGKKPGLPSSGIPGAPSIPDEVANLSRQVKKLESVLKLMGFIQVVQDKMIASSGKDEEIETSIALCQAVGGRLATPKNEAENNGILYFVKNYNRYAYLGLKEGPIPGIFHYSNGIPALYTQWRKNEPSGKGQEKCVEMYTDGQWNDKGCNQRRLTVCEF